MSGISGGNRNGTESVASLIESEPKGCAFKFRLSTGDGGTYRSPEALTENEAQDALFKKYGLTVVSVIMAAKS